MLVLSLAVTVTLYAWNATTDEVPFPEITDFAGSVLLSVDL